MRSLLSILLLGLTLPALAQDEGLCQAWPQWTAFHNRFVQADGRVIDFQAEPGITTSEGQAYAMFFALVADQRDLYATLLDWTNKHLTQQKLGEQLPAWLWGLDRQQRWRVLDPNSATDADLWIAYSLLEAGRLWNVPAYTILGNQVLRRVKEQLVVQAPGRGPLLLPGPEGFEAGDSGWMLNPSYTPPMLLDYFALIEPEGPWRALRESNLDMLRAMPGMDVAPDWVRYDRRMGWRIEPSKESLGGYEAIRVYLWAGMLAENHPQRAGYLDELGDLVKLIDRSDTTRIPEYVNFVTGEVMGTAPAGFSAALLPYLYSLNRADLIESQLERLSQERQDHLLGDQQNYYDQVLALFGEGWFERRFQFSRSGHLEPAWATDCS